MSEIKQNDRVNRLCYLLGIATAMIISPNTCKTDREWWLHALEEVVYKDNPVPPIPEK